MARSYQQFEGRRRYRFVWAYAPIVALISVSLYAGSIGHGFLASWDDGAYLIDNALLRAPGGLFEIWSRVELPRTFPNYPLVFTSFWLEARLFDLDPRIVHLNNVLLHAVAAVLCLVASRTIGLGRTGALFVALLFAIHPTQVESVAWATERKNVLSGAFWFAAFVCFRCFRVTGRTSTYVGSLALFLCAMLSKTTALTLPISLWLADVVLDRRPAWRSAARLAPMLIVGAAFGLLTTAIEHADGIASSVNGWVALPLRPLQMSSSLTFYLQKLFWPWELLPLYPRFDLSLARPGPWLLLAAWVAASVALVARWRQLDRRVLWGLGHFVVTLAPVAGGVYFDFLSRSDVADRFVYLACVGVFIAVVAPIETAIQRGSARRGAAVLVAATLCLGALALRTWNQQRVWRNDLVFWQHAVGGNPHSFDVQVNLARTLHDQGERHRDLDLLARAATHYEEALLIRPRDWRARNNLANLLAQRGDSTGSLEQFARAIELNPRSAVLHANRAGVRLASGRLDAAIDDYRRAIELEPGRSSWYAALGDLLLRHDLPDRAARWLAAGRQIAPHDPDLALLLARALAAAGRRPDALARGGEACDLARAAGASTLLRICEQFVRQLEASAPAPDGS